MSARQRGLTGIVLLVTVVGPLVLSAPPAIAFPKGDSVFGFNYKVVATAHVQKQNLTLSPPPGIFKGAIDLDTGQLKGKISIPPATFTQSEAGIGLVTATAAMEQLKPVTGHVDFDNFKVTATSVFNIHILTLYPAAPSLPPLPIQLPLPIPPLPPLPIPPINLVGNHCITASPVQVTMTGVAHIGQKSTFTGTFSIPDFKGCQALTTVLNQEIPGGGNSFSATATPV